MLYNQKVSINNMNTGINLNRLKARIRRKGVITMSGDYYQDLDSELIKKMNANEKSAIFGILREDGAYTVLGSEKIYFRTIDGKISEMTIEDFEGHLAEYAQKKGKEYEFEIIPVGSQNYQVWVLNSQWMFSFWNLLIYRDSWCNG